MKLCNLMLYSLGLLAIVWPGAATASLIMILDQSAYTTNVSGTVVVTVSVAQTSDGPQVTAGNELLTAAINVAFNSPSGIASVLSLSDIAGNPLFDAYTPLLSPTTATLGETSVAGISDLSVPLMLGTFTFTGLAPGSTTIQASAEGPGPSFVTAGANNLDPANTATAIITVVPEPSTLVLGTFGFGLVSVLRCWRARGRLAEQAHSKY